MASQLSKKAALPLAKILATCRNNVSNTGPWSMVSPMDALHWCYITPMASRITSNSTFFNRQFKRVSQNTSKLRVTVHCEGNPPVTGGFPHKEPVAEKTFSWRRHGIRLQNDSLTFSAMIWKRFSHYWPFAAITRYHTWRHDMETFSELQAICEGIHWSPVMYTWA